MAKIEIDGVAYPFPEADDLSYREMAFVQQVCNGQPLEGNINAVIGLAYVALQRAGRTPSLDQLYDLKLGALKRIPEVGDDDYEGEEVADVPLEWRDGQDEADDLPTDAEPLPLRTLEELPEQPGVLL
jgi:hypothetical protein